jgi:hypothetical protein
MQSIHIRGAYLNVSGSKTANYSPASYAEHTNFGARRTCERKRKRDRAASVAAESQPSVRDAPDAAERRDDHAGDAGHSGPRLARRPGLQRPIRAKDGQRRFLVARHGQHDTGRWLADVTYSLSESTTGRSYSFVGNFGDTVTDDTAALGSCTVTYTSGDLSKTL